MNEISEAKFLTILHDGVKRTTDFMAQLTEYHGGPIKTEYILTADIARVFLSDGHEVRVEKINRQLVNGFTKRKGWKPKKKFGAQRSDVAVTNSDLIPLALVEVKIGVGKSISKIRKDLEKMANVIESLQPKFASRIRAASVFQVHVAGGAKDAKVERLKLKVEKIEKSISKELTEFQRDWPNFSFSLKPLLNANEGFVPTAIEIEDDGSEALGENGHATRYYAVTIGFQPKTHSKVDPNST